MTVYRKRFILEPMLTIRLQRVGKKNQASFRIVLAEKYRAAKKQVLEILGHYNPRNKDFAIKDPERLKYWIAQHVQLSPTVNNLLIAKGLLTGEKVKAWRPKKKETESPAAETVSGAPAAEAAPAEGAAVAAVAETPAESKPEAAPVSEAPEAAAPPPLA